jgi:hypothetical protein
VPWNSPNTGQAGSATVAQCCSNALSLCQYVGNQQSTNYQNLLKVTVRSCREFVPSGTQQAICDFQGTPRNCGAIPGGTP